MYRSNPNIIIDDEDEIGSSSYETIDVDQIDVIPWMYFLRHGLRFGISVTALLALVNTVTVEEVQAKITGASSAIVEKKEVIAPYNILSTKEPVEERMSDEEFSEAMAALEDIWEACPADAPTDLSIHHDSYLYGKKG